MQIRTLIIAASGVAALAVAGAVAWEALPGRVGGLIEARLARDTGLRWRIGGLALDPGLDLVLDDVTVRDGRDADGPSGRLRRVRASVPFGLLLGRGGTIRAQVEGASLTLPLTGLARGAGPAGREPARDGSAGPGLAAIRATLRGAGMAVEGGRTLALSADDVDLALDAEPDSGSAPAGGLPAIRLDLPEQGALVEVAAGAGEAARRLTLTLAPADGPRIAASAQARLDGPRLRLDGIAGTVGPAPFQGSLAVDVAGTKPQITTELHFDALALTDGDAPAPIDPAAAVVPVRAVRVPEPGWFADYEARAAVTIRSLALGPVAASTVGITAQVRDGRLDLGLDTATLSGGTARGRYVLEPDDRAGCHAIGLGLSGVRVGPLLRTAAGSSGLDGLGSARLDVQARGSTREALLRSAAGRAEIAVTDGRIDGLDLARAAGLTGLTGGPTTRLDRLSAHLAIGEGWATTDDLQIRTGLLTADGGGGLDLIGRTLDLRLKARGGGRLDVPVRIVGPWDGPSVSADLSGLARDPAGALEGLTEFGARILGGQGSQGGPGGPKVPDDLGGLLDGLLGRRPPPGRRP